MDDCVVRDRRLEGPAPERQRREITLGDGPQTRPASESELRRGEVEPDNSQSGLPEAGRHRHTRSAAGVENHPASRQSDDQLIEQPRVLAVSRA